MFDANVCISQCSHEKFPSPRTRVRKYAISAYEQQSRTRTDEVPDALEKALRDQTRVVTAFHARRRRPFRRTSSAAGTRRDSRNERLISRERSHGGCGVGERRAGDEARVRRVRRARPGEGVRRVRGCVVASRARARRVSMPRAARCAAGGVQRRRAGYQRGARPSREPAVYSRRARARRVRRALVASGARRRARRRFSLVKT